MHLRVLYTCLLGANVGKFLFITEAIQQVKVPGFCVHENYYNFEYDWFLLKLLLLLLVRCIPQLLGLSLPVLLGIKCWDHVLLYFIVYATFSWEAFFFQHLSYMHILFFLWIPHDLLDLNLLTLSDASAFDFSI